MPTDEPRLDGGYLFFYASEHADLLVKILDGTQINGFFWFAAEPAARRHLRPAGVRAGRVRREPGGRAVTSAMADSKP